MSGYPYFEQTLAATRKVGTIKNTFTTAASVLNPQDLVTLTPNLMSEGATFRLRARGGLSNVITAQPTFTFQFMMGSIAAWTSGPLTTNTTANTLLPFTLDLDLRLDSTGSGTSAKFLGMAMFTCASMATGFTGVNVPTTAPAVGTGFDSTIANIADLFVACQTSNAGNGVQIYTYSFEQIFA